MEKNEKLSIPAPFTKKGAIIMAAAIAALVAGEPEVAEAHKVDGCQHIHGPRGSKYYREVWIGYNQPASCVQKMKQTGASKVYHGGRGALLRMFDGNVRMMNVFTRWHDKRKRQGVLEHCVPRGMFPATLGVRSEIRQRPQERAKTNRRSTKARYRSRRTARSVRMRQSAPMVKHPQLGVIPWNKAMMLLCSQKNCGR